MCQRLEGSRMTSIVLVWATAMERRRRGGFVVEDSEFIQLGTAVCVVPVGIRGQGEVSCCFQKARDGQKQGRHTCVVKGRRRSRAEHTEPSVGKARVAGEERAGREVGGPGEWRHEGQCWRACLLGLRLRRSRW